jgi:hypothetical protein
MAGDGQGAGYAVRQSAPPVPLLASVAAVAVYVAIVREREANTIAVLGSLAAGIAIWLALVVLGRRSGPSTAHPRLYLTLISDVDRVAVMLTRAEERLDRLNDPDRAATERARVAAMRSNLVTLAGRLEYNADANQPPATRDLRGSDTNPVKRLHGWSAGVAYSTAFRDLHAIESDAILIADRNELVGLALYEYMRLTDSKIADKQREMLAHDLTMAVATLRAPRPHQVFEPPKPPEFVTAEAWALPNTDDLERARSLIRTVDLAVTDFRDSLYEALLAQREQGSLWVFATGALIYLLVAFAILVFTPVPQLLSGTTLFAVGAWRAFSTAC